MNALNKLDNLLKSGVPFSCGTHCDNCAQRDECQKNGECGVAVSDLKHASNVLNGFHLVSSFQCKRDEKSDQRSNAATHPAGGLCSHNRLRAQRPPLAVPPVMPAGFIENLKQKSPEDLPETLVNACIENSGLYAWGEKQTEIQLFGIKSVAGSEYHACAQWVWFAEYASEAA